jgi:hypothetical protein
VAVWAFAGLAAAQSLDSVVEDALDEQVDAAVEDAVTEAVEATVNDTVEQQVESSVAETIQQQVESGVIETIQQQVESGVVETIENQIATGVVGTIEEQVEAGIESAIGASGENDDASTDDDGDAQEGESNAAATAAFVAAVDTVGRAIERDVWVVLVPAQYADRIEGWGFTVRQRLDLGALDRVLLRVDAPEDRDVAQAALELAIDAPGTSIDLNHVYDTSQRTPTEHAGIIGGERSSARVAGPAPGAEIGMIDTAVAVGHPALQGIAIEQRDFVPFAGARPLGHGTAVASILSGTVGSESNGADAGKIWAATVFFEDAAGGHIATTASLVMALDWLAGAGRVHVINMSLTGPANHVLEAAIDDVVARGLVIVAAVGNNGPTGAPMYPAAYETVVGITAVDSASHIYRHANRGKHVKFAAPGVRVEVADAAGGFHTATGTSMAAPYAAGLLADAASRSLAPPAEIIERFERSVLDLGEPGFDEVFGFGLIAPSAEPALRTRP